MYIEPNLNDRIEEAQKMAERISSGQVDTNGEFELSLRLIVSKQYNIPLFSEYFDNLTMDQLLLEVELVRLSKMSPEQKASELINSNKEELSGLFDDIEGFEPPPMNPDENNFMKDAMEFMKTGDFKQEGE